MAATHQSSTNKAYIITGPTAGIGRATALELAKHGTVVLVGRDPGRLAGIQRAIEGRGQHAVSVVCDLSDVASARHAAAEIVALGLPIAGLLNNAGVMQTRPTQNGKGWDVTFATNHLGPFALTEALVPHLPDGAHVLFVGSAVEDPGRKPAVAAGFRGARYLSAEASARAEWRPGGSSKPGMDAYATSKQCAIATALAFARENSRLRFNAIEPGFTPATSLGRRDVNLVVRALLTVVVPLVVALLLPFVKILSTPKRSARVLTRLLTATSGPTGTYFDEAGVPMVGSAEVGDPAFQDRVVAETREFLAANAA
jgi:NAD(P)-dependent dehydrogenase (short-subunit alcohol dehydrogenase family)